MFHNASYASLQSPLTDVTLEDPPKGCVESSHIPGLVYLLKKILKIERTAQEQMTTQNYFILGLVVKAIRVALTVSVLLCGVGWVHQNHFQCVCVCVCVCVSVCVCVCVCCVCVCVVCVCVRVVCVRVCVKV